MIYDLADTAQKQALSAAAARHRLLYGGAFILRLGRNRILLLEPWDPRAAMR